MQLTRALVIHYAMVCGHVDAGVAEQMAGIAWRESHFETTSVSPPNRDGSHDIGPYQINENNLARLHLTRQTAMDPCEASRAAATWFDPLSIYNTGNRRDGYLNGYVASVYAARHDDVVAIPAPAAAPPQDCATVRETWRTTVACRPLGDDNGTWRTEPKGGSSP